MIENVGRLTVYQTFCGVCYWNLSLKKETTMIDTTQPEVDFAVSMMTKAIALAPRILAGMAVQGLTKSDFSPVTVADFAIQAIVGKALMDTFPDDVLVGEENADMLRAPEGEQVLQVVTGFVQKQGQDATKEDICTWIDSGTAATSNRFWTLDPIDGTKGFLRGGQYATALALIEDGKVVLGVLGCPNLGDNCMPDMGMGATLVAQRGQGTWLSVLNEPFQSVSVSGCKDTSRTRILRSVEASHTNAEKIDHIAEFLKVVEEPVRLDSQAKYGVLASGGAEMLFRLLSSNSPDYKERIWDQAAGSIVLEEAGGRITDLKGQDLDFGQGRTLANNTGVFASNGILHDAGLEAIAAACQLD
jgi:3'(2'), 5'-bisphosphate nucleotidase